MIARRDGRCLLAAALPRATSQVRNPRLGAADRARAWDQPFPKRNLVQSRDHRRRSRQLRRLQPAIAMAEALARLCDAHKFVKLKMLAHARQHLEREVQQERGLACRGRHEFCFEPPALLPPHRYGH
jgi:hypothetical protein